MKITTKAGLVGFLLALSSLNLPKAEATTVNNPHSETSIESRLVRIAKVIKEKENQAERPSDNTTDYTVGQFLNIGSGWRNGGSGWRNGGWRNGWHNGGWRNGWHNGGWRNGWNNAWRNGGGGWGNWASPSFRNGGSFLNR